MVGSDLPPSHAERRGKGMSVFKDEDEDDDDMRGMMCSQQLPGTMPCRKYCYGQTQNNSSVRQTLSTPPGDRRETGSKRLSHLSKFPPPASGRNRIWAQMVEQRHRAESMEMPPAARCQTWEGLRAFPPYLPFLQSTPDGLAVVNTQKISRHLTDEKGSENVSTFLK